MRPVVFLSRPAELSATQEAAFCTWQKLLGVGFDLQRLQRGEYADEPWAQLRTIFTQVDGVVSFGFRHGRQAAQPDSGSHVSDRTSPWIHIEAAIAVTLRLPVLAVAEEGITDGIFDPAAWTAPVYGVPAGADPYRRTIRGPWTQAVRLAFEQRNIQTHRDG